MTKQHDTGRHAIIAGGGIGGLAAAIGLRRVGWSVTVLERAGESREVGAGWSFAPNALKAIDALGIGAEFRAISQPSEAAVNLLTPDGKYLMKFEKGRDTTLLANHRGDLQQLLQSHLPADSVRTGAEVTGVEQTDAAVTVTYRSGDDIHRQTADVLIGADGIHSAVRTSVWPHTTDPVFQRILVWRGVTAPGSVWPVDGFQTWGRGVRFAAHPISEERVFWFVAIRQPEPHVHYDDDMAEVVERVGTWHDPIPKLVAATPPQSLLRNDVSDLDPLRAYAKGRMVLLGDAAHAMTPFLAQGACQSLEDATVLAAELAGDADIPAALARYDSLRRPRTQTVQRGARQDPSISLSTNAFVYATMTRLTALVGSRIAARKTAHLWNWTPPSLDGHPVTTGTGR